MTGSDEPIKTYDLAHSPGEYNPGLLILAKIITRVHLARLANNAQAVTDNGHSDAKLNQQTDHEDIP
jgi:hypothetical protein